MMSCWASCLVEENKDINKIRERVEIWSMGGTVEITKPNSRLYEQRQQ